MDITTSPRYHVPHTHILTYACCNACPVQWICERRERCEPRSANKQRALGTCWRRTCDLCLRSFPLPSIYARTRLRASNKCYGFCAKPNIMRGAITTLVVMQNDREERVARIGLPASRLLSQDLKRHHTATKRIVKPLRRYGRGRAASYRVARSDNVFYVCIAFVTLTERILSVECQWLPLQRCPGSQETQQQQPNNNNQQKTTWKLILWPSNYDRRGHTGRKSNSACLFHMSVFN